MTEQIIEIEAETTEEAREQIGVALDEAEGVLVFWGDPRAPVAADLPGVSASQTVAERQFAPTERPGFAAGRTRKDRLETMGNLSVLPGFPKPSRTGQFLPISAGAGQTWITLAFPKT